MTLNTVVWDIDTYSLTITYEKTSSWTKNKNLKNFEHLVSKVPAAGWRQENSPASLVHPRNHHLLLNNHHHDQRHMLDHHDHHLARSKRFSLVTLTPLTRAASHSFLSCSIRYLNKQIHILYALSVCRPVASLICILEIEFTCFQKFARKILLHKSLYGKSFA